MNNYDELVKKLREDWRDITPRDIDGAADALQALQAECDELRAKLEALAGQRPVGWATQSGGLTGTLAPNGSSHDGFLYGWKPLYPAAGAQPLHDSEDSSVWSRYVAGMICTYLKADADSCEAEAVAGIIERRLKFLRNSETAKPLRELSDEEIDAVVDTVWSKASCARTSYESYKIVVRAVLAAASKEKP